MNGTSRPTERLAVWDTLTPMSGSNGGISLQDLDTRTRSPEHPAARGPRNAKSQALRILPGATFVLAGVYLALAVGTLLNGEFRPGWLLLALPAIAAAFLTVRGVRRSSLPLCTSALALLCVWGALSVALTSAMG